VSAATVNVPVPESTGAAPALAGDEDAHATMNKNPIKTARCENIGSIGEVPASLFAICFRDRRHTIDRRSRLCIPTVALPIGVRLIFLLLCMLQA
jgi:hypothetical protein